MSRSISDVLVLIGLLVMLAGAWGYAAADGATVQRVENESATVEANSSTYLDRDAVRYGDPTVIVNNTTYERGEQYTLGNWSGELAWTAAASADDGEQATISYDAHTQDETTSELAGILTPLRTLWPVLVFLGVGGMVIATIKNSWGM